MIYLVLLNILKLNARNDKLAEKNGTKKTVYWVNKKPREETGNIKGEK